MKRRTFIRRTSIGLPALAAGLGGALGRLRAGEGKRRIYGLPDTDLPPQVWHEVVALGLLAQDVFDRSEVAEVFARDPRGYLASIGMEGAVLDTAAVEVRVALALGDPEVGAAIRNDDAKAFLRAMEDRGLLQAPEPSQLAERLQAHLESLPREARPGSSPEACTAVVICIALVWVWVAYALVWAWTTGPKKRPPDEDELGREPSFRLAGALGGGGFKQRAMRAFVEENVEKIAAAVEELRLYREHRPMEGEQLRRLVRAQMLRQFGGHAVDFPVPR
jgi:hypothetical protein